jgi:transposase
LRLFVGDDWAEDHHDVEVMEVSGRRLAKARLPEGVAGMARLHAMIAEQIGDGDPDEVEVVVGIETDRGPWVAALVAAGYTVFAVNPLQASRYRERHGVSGAKSDAADAHMLADMVRTDAHQLRTVAADSVQAEAIKVVSRMHKTLIWERTRHAQRLRHALREYFPAALEAFADLDAADTLELLAKAPDPASAAKLTIGQISAALKRARRRDVPGKAAGIQAALRADHLGQPAVVTAAYAASVRALAAVLVTLNEQIKTLQGQVEAHPRRPGARRVRRRPAPVRLGQGPQELRRHQPDHQSIRQKEDRPGPARAQRPAHRCPDGPGLLRADRLSRRPRLLRPATRPRRRPQPRPPPTRQPTRRHPARLPQNRHTLRRSNRLAPPHQISRSLTSKPLGCLASHHLDAARDGRGYSAPS